MLLNLGCGGHYSAEPWVNVDVYHGPGCYPDVRADVTKRLPFADGSAEAVYCGHLLEHIKPEDMSAALAEIRRVLHRRGRLLIVGPDIGKAAANPEWHPLLLPIIEGGSRWPGDEHQWTPTAALTLGFVQPVFPRAEEVDLATLTGWPIVDYASWQFAILA